MLRFLNHFALQIISEGKRILLGGAEREPSYESIKKKCTRAVKWWEVTKNCDNVLCHNNMIDDQLKENLKLKVQF